MVKLVKHVQSRGLYKILMLTGNKYMTIQVCYSKTQDIEKLNALPIVGQGKLIGKNVMVHVAIS